MRRASSRLAKIFDSGALLMDAAWDFVYGEMENPDYLEKLFAYRYWDQHGPVSVLGGRAGANAPLAYGRSTGYWAGEPMNFYKGSMYGDDISDVLTFAHEVLHRNPQFANQWYQASNQVQYQQVHTDMGPALLRLENLLRNGAGR